MKQVVLLEDYEIAKLVRGRQIEVVTPGGILMIGFEKRMDPVDRMSEDAVEPKHESKHRGKNKNGAGRCKLCKKHYKNLKLHNVLKHKGGAA
jgi:hypothetical protein